METGAVNRNKIKQLLEHELHKIKKGDLCKAIKIPPASLHNYLNELTDPNTPTLQKICDYFRIPMTDLLTNQIYDSSPDSLLTSDEIEILNLYRQRTGDYVFESPRIPGHPIQYADPAIKRFAKEAGVTKNVYAHLFRHSVASHMLEWANIRTIQSFLGHSEIQTTEWYTHLNVEHLRTASDQVAQGYGRPLSLVKGK